MTFTGYYIFSWQEVRMIDDTYLKQLEMKEMFK